MSNVYFEMNLARSNLGIEEEEVGARIGKIFSQLLFCPGHPAMNMIWGYDLANDSRTFILLRLCLRILF